MTYRTVDTDVLVVGSGGAGLRAAIAVHERGAQALLVSKGAIARSGASPMAGADLTCHGQGMREAGFFGEPRDSVEKFMSDIVHQGSFLNDQPLTEIYVRDGPARLKEMVDWGTRVTFTDERAIFAPGTSMMDALRREARRLGVAFEADVAILELLVEGGRVVGALGLDLKRGEFIAYRARAVILATGGWHKAFTPLTGSRELTGDGIAMAYRAGAELVDMEFVTFCCNVIYWPPVYRGSIFTYVMGMLFGASLEDADGNDIFAGYDPEMVAYASRTEWNKSFISHASARAMREGRASPHGGIYYRLPGVSYQEYASRTSRNYPGWVFHGADFSGVGEMLRSGEGVEVGPGAEYFEGGIAVDERFATSVPGLYAAGECAGSVFGANRVAAATMEMLVMGARAGWAAAEASTDAALAELDGGAVAMAIDRLCEPLARRSGPRPADVRKELQQRSQEKLGPIRTAAELEEYLETLDGLAREVRSSLATASDSRVYNKEWIEALDLASMVTVCGLAARAALARTESRGVHFREDHPETDNDGWLKQIVLRDQDGEPALSTRPVRATNVAPPAGTLPYMEMIKRMMEAHSDVGGHH